MQYTRPATGSTGNFTAGFLDDPDLIDHNQFGYTADPTGIVPLAFDPNVIQTLSVNTFDSEFAYGISSTTAIFTNGSDTLELKDLALPGSLTTVPEPSTLALLVLGTSLIGMSLGDRRRRNLVV